MSRPRKPLISRERAARAALDVIDVQGLHALSVEQVARRLGVRAPSLYYHFKDKAELLAEVSRHILTEVEVPQAEGLDWERTLIELCRATRRAILQHPNAAPLLLEFFPRRLLLSAYDFWTAKCPYPPEMQLAIVEGVEKLTYGSALFAAAGRAYGIDPMPDFDPERYPALSAAVRANPHDEEQLFIETVETLLAGFRARYDAKHATTEEHARVEL
ncbi:MAG: TetR/AcrR family transcriptional regulator [Pseudomonadota bacterium]